MRRRFLVIILFFFSVGPVLWGQDLRKVGQLIAKGDSLHRLCRFEEALAAYGSAAALPGAPDDSISIKTARTRNALALAEMCWNPRVVARGRFSRKDFYLYYPLPSGGWHPAPETLDPEGRFPVYMQAGDDRVFFTAEDLSGSRSRFLSEDRDTVWRAPRLLSESLLTSGTELFPMLSPDGRTLYFASDALPGMGGFDLFASEWDEANAIWGEPRNLGFPFNSPADDFLFADTPDGKYSVFASDRSCGKDSLYVYVVEYEDSPMRVSVRDPEALQTLEALLPSDNSSAQSARPSGNSNTRLYMRRMAEMRALRDTIYRREQSLDLLRQRLSQAGEELVASLSARIREAEEALKPFRRRLDQAGEEIRSVEAAFLRRGAALSQDQEETQKQQFAFEKDSLGTPLRMKVAQEEDVIPLFRISSKGAFAEENVLPEGIVYQIYMFTQPRHATVDDLRGIAPVYERLTSSLRYACFAGLFKTYRQALQYLNLVRLRGFPEARIVAYSDGRSIPVNQARQEE